MKNEYRGQTKLFDENGQSYDFDVIRKSGDTLDKRGWRRVIMSDLMLCLDQIGNQKIKVLEYLIDLMDGKNQINKTLMEISRETKISYKTVSDTFKALKECNLIKKLGGLYVLNCSIVASYGSSEKNKYLVLEYAFDDTKSIIDKKEVKNQKDEEIEKLKIEIEELKKLIPCVA